MSAHPREIGVVDGPSVDGRGSILGLDVWAESLDMRVQRRIIMTPTPDRATRLRAMAEELRSKLEDSGNLARLFERDDAEMRTIIETCLATIDAEVREQCAQIAEKTLVLHGDHYAAYYEPSRDAKEIAAAIRAARSEE